MTNLDDDHPHLPGSLSQAVEGVGEFVSKARRRVVLGPSPRSGRLAAYAQRTRARAQRFRRQRDKARQTRR